MIVNVAGAGAGKTTKMADVILNHEIPECKVVFCVAFTNAAADNIRKKVADINGVIPSNIIISTIHSFLYQEIVEPYFWLLYRKHFKSLSTIDLPTEQVYKASRISELEKEDILHITQIPEKAKWVVYKKSGDTKRVKEIRKRVISYFQNYCEAIFVDEAQDISKDIYLTLCALDKESINITLFGDPKQDVKGYGNFQRILDSSEEVTYHSECYRCPQKHLNLSNRLANGNEVQIADGKNKIGNIQCVFESDIDDLKKYINSNGFELCYISHKMERFETHSKSLIDNRFETLQFEVKCAISKKWGNTLEEIEIARGAYSVTEKMLNEYDANGNVQKIISFWVEKGAFNRLEKEQYARMISAFSLINEPTNNNVVVSSIEIIKGLEADNCLFILTTDLAPYFFLKKGEDNKTKHLLYVALTRSRDELTILITKEVEKKYTREMINGYFSKV